MKAATTMGEDLMYMILIILHFCYTLYIFIVVSFDLEIFD